MTGFWHFLLGLTLTSALHASPMTDPYVRNLTLVGVIHVEGTQAKGQSVAVFHDRAAGKTRILHKGDRLTDSNLELRDLGPQQVTLVRGGQTFVLRVESHSESAAMVSQVETTDVELIEPKDVSPLADTTNPSEKEVAPPEKSERQPETRRLEPDADCTGEECPALVE
jgi:hypothetical protein